MTPTKENSGKRCVITVHGVGVTNPGDSLTGLERRFSRGFDASYECKTISLDGCEFAVRHSEHPEAPELIEVNWADIQRPRQNWFSMFGYLARVLAGSLHLAENWSGTSLARQWIIRGYRVAFEAVVIWKVPFIVYLMLLVSAAQSYRWVVAITGTALIVSATWWVRKWSWPIVLGGVFFSGYYAHVGWKVAASEAGAHSGAFSTWTTEFIQCTSLDYIRGHKWLPIIVLVLATTILWPDRRSTWEQRLARLGFTYPPLLAVALIGACM
ncbi:MAG: hypothetical protein HY735_11815 [Verrucomicrobia bacterium]|nr:hypothetical protein [Verrucomicrobiota bacterium]